MESTTSEFLLFILLILIILSGFFSSSETGMMSINRYRLKHLAKSNHKGAKRVLQLLSRPDKLIGLILIGNNFVNNLAASLTTILAFRYFGYLGDALATTLGTIILTLVVLIFAEVTPKTWAALYPEKIAYPASFILKPLMYLLHPVVWMLNLITNGLLRILGIDTSENSADHITTEELRTIVIEAGAMVPKRHQSMLLSILDLEKVTVNDIMVPRHEIYGIDLDDSDEEINEILNNCQHTRLMVYQGSIDNILGSLHARDALRAEQKTPEPVKQMIRENLRAIHYIPSQTPLNIQMKNFQRKKQRIGLVVNEYGDIQGLVTLEDILEEIVGEFTTDYAMMSKDIHPMDDGSNLIEGTATIRDINRSLGYQLPTDGPKTLNGLVIEYLEAIPPSGSGLKISGHPMEIVQVTDSMIKNVKVFPKQAPKQKPKS